MSDVLKRCTCGESKWNKCSDAWYMSPFRFRGVLYRENVTEWAATVLNETITTRTRADAVVEIMRTRIRDGVFVKARAQRNAPPAAAAVVADTIAQLRERFEQRLDALTRKPHELPVKGDGKCDPPVTRAHKGRLARFAAFNGYGARPIAWFDRNAEAIVAFKASLGTISASDWAKYQNVLRRMFHFAVRHGLLARSPLDLVRGDDHHADLRRHKGAPRTRRLMPGEFERLHHAALHPERNPRRPAYMPQLMADLYTAAREIGQREGELLAIQWQHVVNLSAPYVGGRYALSARVLIAHVEPGARKVLVPVLVPMTAALRAVLERRQAHPVAGQQYKLTDYVFGAPLGERLNFQRHVRRFHEDTVIRSAGEDPVRHGARNPGGHKQQLTAASRAIYERVGLHFHDIRRECASRWYDDGVPLATISRWLGHTSEATTRIYLGILPGDTRDLDEMAAFEARQRERAALAEAVGGSSDHKPITESAASASAARGVRLVKGRKVGADK